MSCKISVIVPVYNVDKYLYKCVSTILKQTLKEIEIICVNDGSTDSSLNILKDFKKEDERIIIIDKKNGGYGTACNKGLEAASGEYISIIESDDFIDEHMFENLYDIAVNNNADIVKSAYYEYKESKDEEEESVNKINWSMQYNMPNRVFTIDEYPQFLYFHPSIWSCIYKTSFIKNNNIKFVEPKGAGWADNPFQVKTLCLADRICYTDRAYYYYRLTNDNSSSTVVNINNPFDRSREIHSFLEKNNINNENMLANLYKREFSYIDIVLSCITEDMFDYSYKKVKELISRMDKSIIYENNYVNDYERKLFCSAQNKEELYNHMMEVKQRNNHQSCIAVKY